MNTAQDMNAVIVPKSDQINADDLIGGPKTITIREVQIKGGQEQPVSIYFDGSDKAYRPCKSMCRVLVAVWGPDAKEYRGRSLTLYRDAAVKWGGMEVGGIRISHMTHMTGPMTMALTATKGSRKPYTIKPLVIQQQTDPVADDMLAMLRTEATKGTQALQAAWTALPQDIKRLLKDHLTKLKETAAAVGGADASNPPAA